MRHMQKQLWQRVQRRIKGIDDPDTLAQVEAEYRDFAHRTVGSWRQVFIEIANNVQANRLDRLERCGCALPDDDDER